MSDTLISGVIAGNHRAVARVLRLTEDDPEAARPILEALYPHTGRAHVIGVTGNPGAGKSTLVDALIGVYRDLGIRVGVVAVDPSSPFTGGAILGDRVRMNQHATDPDVFIRSVATRGTLGGLANATDDMVCVLDAMGCGVVLVETVGVGQSEVDIVQIAQTVVVVLTPGYGDDVQALKAGLLEIADIFVLNKADLSGAKTLRRQLEGLRELARSHRDYKVPIVETVATCGDGVCDLKEAADAHRRYLDEAMEGSTRRKNRLMHVVSRLIRRTVIGQIVGPEGEGIRPHLQALSAGHTTPYAVAEGLIAAWRSGAWPRGTEE